MDMKRSVAAALLTLFTCTANAQDDMSPLWEDVGRWQVRVDTTLDNGCFAIIFENNSVFRFGINNANSTVYGIIGKDGWESIENGKTYDILIEFDSQGAWDVPSYGIDVSGTKGLSFEVGNSLFIEEMIERHQMEVSYNNEVIMEMSMKGSIAAFESLSECMDTFGSDAGGETNGGNDPFAESNNDPFAPNY
jgi:hypothetical protein